MPYQQSWSDPNTGATFPQTYVRASAVQALPNDNQVGLSVTRFVSIATYSAGFQPIERKDLTIRGQTYASWFAPLVVAAELSFNAELMSAADIYIGTLTTLSGATMAL